MRKFKLIKPFIAGIMIATNLTACAQKMDCDIAEEHVHLYINEETGLSRFMDNERQTTNGLSWTEKYVSKSSHIETIVENDLYIVSDNLTYLTDKISQYSPRREAYVNDYIYGTYYGYDYGYKHTENEYGYGYGLTTGWHWEYVWKEIPVDEYTTNRVRDINYQFKFYKFEDDGTLSYKYFNSLEDLEEGYNYFKNDLVDEVVSDSYYIEEQKINVK